MFPFTKIYDYSREVFILTKEEIIRLRNTLKCGKNIPLRILSNNSFFIIDESNVLQFTKWDDTNKVLYSFRMVNPNADITPSNRQQLISVVAVPYDRIEAMEAPYLPIDDIETICDAIKSSGCSFSDDFKKLIKHTFVEALHPDRITLSSSDINSIIGPGAVNDNDDYYYGKYKESNKETLRYRDRNAEANNNSNT